jgi:hypothetical protein
VLEDRYGFIPHFSLVVRQHLSIVLQKSLAVWVEAKPFPEVAHIIFIISVVAFGTYTFSAGSGRLVGFCGALLLSIGRLLWGCTVHFPGWSWQGCTGLFFGGCWRICISMFLGVRWRECTVVLFSRSWRESMSVWPGGCRPDHTSIVLGGCWRDHTSVSLGGSAGCILRSVLSQVHSKPSNIAVILFLFFFLGWWCWRWELLALIRGWR